ncbi:MAG: membrane protein FxsA [Rhizobiaceae bacterium]|nr:membrane protein FxsA [Rhizobiaceae bacterium]
MRFSVLIFLVWPLIEIAGFVIVGREVGVLSTIALTIAMGVLGAALLRHQGFGVLSRLRSEMEAGRSPGRELAHGAMILLAGFLLLVPGFVSDIFGLALFVPPVRDFVWRWLSRNVDFRTVVVSRDFGGAPRRERTIDLDEDDYEADPNPDSPWRRIDRDGR